MDLNTELLNFIHQNSQMAISTLEQVIDILEDCNLKKYLQMQKKEYKDINEEAVKILKENGQEEKDLNVLTKVMTYMSINMKTLADKTPSHIAEMIIQGSTMGVTEATKTIKKYNSADSKILNLAEKLLKTEECNIEELKKFL